MAKMDDDINQPQSYREAMAELKGILDRLRGGDDVDVDELVTDVARAKVLLDFCGAKIRRADAAIKTIVAELQAGQGQPATGEAAGTSAADADDGEDEDDGPGRPA